MPDLEPDAADVPAREVAEGPTTELEPGGSLPGGVILAAGGLLTRPGSSEPRIAVVHRLRYGGDWTLPKGKLQPGETWQAAALREVREETGYPARITGFAGAFGYTVGDSPKVVAFWRMEVTGDADSRALTRDEVQEVRWLSIRGALRRLQYPQERALVMRTFCEPNGAQRKHLLGARWGGIRARGQRAVRWAARLLGLKDHRRERLEGALGAFQQELDYRQCRSERDPEGDRCWQEPAHELLVSARAALARGDAEEGWQCLSAARRLTLFGLQDKDLRAEADALRQEAQKIGPSWRATAITQLLELGAAPQPRSSRGVQNGNPSPSSYAVHKAMEIRDENFNNQYFKLDLLASQLKLLSLILWLAFAAFMLVLIAPAFEPLRQLPLLGSTHGSAPDARTALLISLFGIVGASFSALLSTARIDPKGRIPERLSQHALTISRAVMGAPAALLAVLFLQTGLLKVDGLDAANVFLILLVAFAAGFSERLVVRAVESVSGES